MKAHELSEYLKNAFQDASITVKDLTGTEDHWEVSISSEAFRGLSLVAQHRKVYGALGDLGALGIHALSLNTLTP